MNILFRRDLYNGDPIVNFEEDGKVVGFVLMMQEPQYRSLRLSCLEDIVVFIDGEEFHMMDDMMLETSTGMKDPKLMETMVTDRWDFGECAKIYVYKDGGKWYADFVLTSFSDFTMTQDIDAPLKPAAPSSKVPVTADGSQPMMYALIMMICLGGTAAAFIIGKKKCPKNK